MDRGDGLEWLGAVIATFGPVRLSLYDDPDFDLGVDLVSFSSSAEDFELDDVE